MAFALQANDAMPRRPAGTLVLIVCTLVLTGSPARADRASSGGAASYAARGDGNARVTVSARGKSVAITAFVWTAATGTATWKLATIENGAVVSSPQVFQTSAERPLSADETAAIRERRISLSRCALYYCPAAAEDENVWTSAYKRNWLPAPGQIETPHDLVNGSRQRVTTLPLVAPFAVSRVALVPEPGRWVTKTESHDETYWTTETLTFTREVRFGTEDKYGNQRWEPWQPNGTRTETRRVQKTRTIYTDKRVWEPHPESLWIREGSQNAEAPAKATPPDPDRLITLEAKYDEATGLTTVVVTLGASVTYARAYATIPGDENGPAQFAGTTASAGPQGTHARSTTDPRADEAPPQKTPVAPQTTQPRRRRWFSR